MFILLFVVGGFLAIFGGLIFIIDAFKVHWGWGVSVIFIPFAQLVCLIKHWVETRKGFLISFLAVPFLVGGIFTMPKQEVFDATGKSSNFNDPIFNIVQRARTVAAEAKKSREEPSDPALAVPAVAIAPVTIASPPAEAVPAATPKLSLSERFARNRAAFKALETDFAALDAKRKSLPKNDKAAIATFNREAQAYTVKLAEVRSEQTSLLELQRTAQK